MYSLPLIVGGMIGSIIPLIGCIFVGIILLNKEFFKGEATKPEHIESIDTLDKRAVPCIASAVAVSVQDSGKSKSEFTTNGVIPVLDTGIQLLIENVV